MSGQEGLQEDEEAGAMLTGTEERTAERGGGRESDAMSQSAAQAWSQLHVIRCV